MISTEATGGRAAHEHCHAIAGREGEPAPQTASQNGDLARNFAIGKKRALAMRDCRLLRENAGGAQQQLVQIQRLSSSLSIPSASTDQLTTLRGSLAPQRRGPPVCKRPVWRA